MNFTQEYVQIDYSENIALKPKNEGQSSHYSGRQQTLHCCVHFSEEDPKYIFHLLDDICHDRHHRFKMEEFTSANTQLIDGVIQNQHHITKHVILQQQQQQQTQQQQHQKLQYHSIVKLQRQHQQQHYLLQQQLQQQQRQLREFVKENYQLHQQQQKQYRQIHDQLQE